MHPKFAETWKTNAICCKTLTLRHKQGIVQNATTTEKVVGLIFLVTKEGLRIGIDF